MHSPQEPATEQAHLASLWQIDSWRLFPLTLGVLLLVVATIFAAAPTIAILGLSGGAAVLLCFGLRLWWFPLTVVVPHLIAAGLLAIVWMGGSSGALLGWAIVLQAMTAAALLVAMILGPRGWAVVYLVPAAAIGLSVVQGVDLWLLGVSPRGIAPVIALMGVHAVALTLVLRRVVPLGAVLLWALAGLVALGTNQREWLRDQHNVLSLREHLLEVSGTAPGLKDAEIRADGITWGREDALVRILYVMTLDDGHPECRLQLHELLALAPDVVAGRVHIQVDVTSDLGHSIPLLVQALWNERRSEGEPLAAGKAMLEFLEAVKSDTLNNMTLTFIDSLEAARPGKRAAMVLTASAPALLDRLDRQVLAHRASGVTGIPQLVIARSTGVRRKTTILLRSTDPVAVTALRSHL